MNAHFIANWINMVYRSKIWLFVLAVAVGITGCISYGFTGTSIPKGINTVYIPFFANQTSSSIPDLSDRLNNILIDRFISQSSLSLASNRASADAVLEGSIIRYSNQPFSISGQNQATQNEVKIVVKATFRYPEKGKIVYSQRFSGSATYDPSTNPIEGETNAAQEALEQIANNMFNSAVSGW